MSQGTKAALDDLKHAGEFTKIENTAIVYVLRGWFGSLSAIPGHWKPETTLGRLPRFKNISTANSIPTRPSEPGSRWFSLGLQKKAKKTQDRVDEILGAESDEDKRINKLVDAFVGQLVKQF